MATQRNPNDPRDPRNDVYRADDPDRATDPGRADDPYRPIDPTTQPDLDGDEIRHTLRRETRPQADPALDEGPASGGRIAIVAFAIAVLLGALFYGLNNSSMHRNGSTSSTAQNAAPASPQAVPSPTPGGNAGKSAAPGTTTGAAPSPTAPPPASSPPAGNAPASK